MIHSRAPFFRSLTICLLLAAGSTSCKTAARSEAISPDRIKIERQHLGQVHVSASCPREGILAGPRIPPGHLVEATEHAILESALFEKLASADESDFLLDARVETIEEEDYSLDMTATVRIEWELKRPGEEQPLWLSSIKTSHKVTPYDSRDMKERLLLALEGATRKNIKKAIQRLAKIDLPSPSPTSLQMDRDAK